MRRPLSAVALLLVLGVVARADVVAAGVLVVGLVALWFVLRHRGRRRVWLTAVGVVTGVTLVAVIAALAVPVFRAGHDPLLVAADQATQSQDLSHRHGTFELNGYVISDNNDAAAAVDQQAPNLSSVSATGALVNPNGTFEYMSAQNALVHAHFGGARAQLVVQNYDPNLGQSGDFSPALAGAALASPASRQAFVDDIAAVVTRDRWDGVVIDFELLNRPDQPGLLDLLSRLRTALPSGSRLTVALPVPQADNPTSLGYDLAAVARVVDVVQLMTYDQSDPTSSPGPIGSLTWIEDAVTSALSFVPADKLQIGAASYGYAWGPSATRIGQSFSPAQGRAAAAAAHVTPSWDAVGNGWTAHLPDGTVLWWSDTRSIANVVDLALRSHLEGAAVWELSTAEPLGSIAAKIPLDRVSVSNWLARGMQSVQGRGLVALTFDDGPDPAWTPQILGILKANGVPGTFFDVGMNAEANPALVQQEIAQGNVVANHTYSHLDLTALPLWRAKLEIGADNWVLQGITGREPTLFRSPYGALEFTDSQSATHQNLASSLGMQPVGWDVDPLDWARPGVQEIVRAAASSSAVDQVILLHDGGGDRSQTVAAIPYIIAQMHARGYVFVTPDQLDASIVAPYQPAATTFWGNARNMVLIATYKLWRSAHEVTTWALVVIGLLSLLRLLVSFPLAVVHRRRSRKTVRRSPGTDEGHTVTVLIPAHNEQATIATTMAALARVRGPLVQVIVAENGSTDVTAATARDEAARHPHIAWDIRECGPVGKAGALNACLSDVVGDVVVLLDADTVLDPDFVTAVLPHFDAPGVGAVAGNVKVGNRHLLLGRLQAFEYISSLALDRRAQAQLGVVSVVPGAAGAFRRDALVRVGGWPSRTLTEDADLTVELLAAGWKIPYESGAISWTEAPATVRELLQQRRRWSYGTTQVTELHRHRMMLRSSGRLGLIGLPWLTLSQVILPALGPVVDLFLVWLVLNGDWAIAASMLALAIAIDAAVATWALRSDGESLRFLLLLPAARFLWRPLMLFAVAGGLRSWILGRAVGWNQATRHNTAAIGASSETSLSESRAANTLRPREALTTARAGG
ncbi:MAG: glycosyltransferase [Cellulomonas sp.]|uniref:glycosyltransferase n=1 Tax=Cellulomonas sp. TaxID=40001 RepID=UPI0017FF3FD5|nr:glycosyltransferase [Cellulomonas sp.]NMM17612.1 glycosyltransferase [Cellulomonas sp.]NMM30552.1 glycosyltransferase [Cellulomonas sp.]